MKKFLLLTMVGFFCLTCFQCNPGPAEVSSAGVVLYGWASDGWIKNTKDFPVRIKQVWIFRGETTEWIEVFEPGQIRHQFISHQHGFHIYNTNGVEIGWLRPQTK